MSGRQAAERRSITSLARPGSFAHTCSFGEDRDGPFSASVWPGRGRPEELGVGTLFLGTAVASPGEISLELLEPGGDGSPAMSWASPHALAVGGVEPVEERMMDSVS